VRILAASVGNCVHTGGIVNFLKLAEKHGYETHFLGPATPVARLVQAFAARPSDIVAVSYRLTPETGRAVLEEVKAAKAAGKFGAAKLLFGGTPEVAAIAAELGAFDWVVHGGESPAAIEAWLTGKAAEMPPEAFPGTLLERVAWAAPMPLIRHHFGRPTLEETVAGARVVAEARVLEPSEDPLPCLLRPGRVLLDEPKLGTGRKRLGEPHPRPDARASSGGRARAEERLSAGLGGKRDGPPTQLGSPGERDPEREGRYRQASDHREHMFYTNRCSPASLPSGSAPELLAHAAGLEPAQAHGERHREQAEPEQPEKRLHRREIARRAARTESEDGQLVARRAADREVREQTAGGELAALRCAALPHVRRQHEPRHGRGRRPDRVVPPGDRRHALEERRRDEVGGNAEEKRDGERRAEPDEPPARRPRRELEGERARCHAGTIAAVRLTVEARRAFQ